MNRNRQITLAAAILSLALSSSLFAEDALVQKTTSLEKPVNHGGFLAFAFSPDT